MKFYGFVHSFFELFASKPQPPLEERVKALPVPLCGDSMTHYGWEHDIGLSCPKCHYQAVQAQKDAEMNMLADKIVERLRNCGGL